MIGYYIHHHGVGHLHRASSITAQLHQPVAALTSLDIPSPHPFADVVDLPRDDESSRAAEPAAHGTLHWAPQHHRGLTSRMALIARWIDRSRPAAVVVDVSVEVAIFVRLLGTPVIVMAVPGERTDAPHVFVHQMADHIIAAWPRDFYEPAWLRPHAAKTSYVGGISRFAERPVPPPDPCRARPRVLVLGGAGGGDVDQSMVDGCSTAFPDIDWQALGLFGGRTTSDPWLDICAADVVITHAGQGCVADVAAAGRAAIVLPQSRPFGEQHATAEVLRRRRLATVIRSWPDCSAWRGLITKARGTDPTRWRNWRTEGAAARAARAVEAVAERRADGRTP
jgi:predicted glycosyltransferase